MRIKYKTCKFRGSYRSLNKKNNTLMCTRMEVLWAALTVGKSSSKFSSEEIAFRFTVIDSILSMKTMAIVKSDLLKSMNQSEKVMAAYYIGMTMSKLYANKVLNTVHLIHAENVRGVTRFSKSKSMPDLIGIDNCGNYIVLEAKGTTSNFQNTTVVKAKKQSSVIRMINKKYPVLRVVSYSYFVLDELVGHIEDPIEISDEYIDINFTGMEYIGIYYNPIIELIRKYESEMVLIGTEYFKCVKIAYLDIKIGLNLKVYELIISGASESELHKMLKELETCSEDNLYYGPDGIVVMHS